MERCASNDGPSLVSLLRLILAAWQEERARVDLEYGGPLRDQEQIQRGILNFHPVQTASTNGFTALLSYTKEEIFQYVLALLFQIKDYDARIQHLAHALETSIILHNAYRNLWIRTLDHRDGIEHV